MTGKVCTDTSGCLDDYAVCNSTRQCACKYGYPPHRSDQCAQRKFCNSISNYFIKMTPLSYSVYLYIHTTCMCLRKCTISF